MVEPTPLLQHYGYTEEDIHQLLGEGATRRQLWGLEMLTLKRVFEDAGYTVRIRRKDA